jgi:hypothetical protein
MRTALSDGRGSMHFQINWKRWSANTGASPWPCEMRCCPFAVHGEIRQPTQNIATTPIARPARAVKVRLVALFSPLTLSGAVLVCGLPAEESVAAGDSEGVIMKTLQLGIR